jgi:hypothetical protein
MWTASAESYSWRPIESAPLDEDVTLQVTDGRGKPYTLRNPSRLTVAAGSVRARERRCRSSQCGGGPTTARRLPDDIPPLPIALARRQDAGRLVLAEGVCMIHAPLLR